LKRERIENKEDVGEEGLKEGLKEEGRRRKKEERRFERSRKRRKETTHLILLFPLSLISGLQWSQCGFGELASREKKEKKRK